MVPCGAGRVWAELDAAEWVCLVLFLLVFVICVRQFPQKNNPQPLDTISCTIFGVLYVPFLFSFFVKLLYGWDGPTGWSQKAGMTGALLFFYLVVVVKMTDIGAFFVGRNVGRHKMFPRISPGKTWEGTAGGIVTGTLASVVYFLLARYSAGPGPWHLGRLGFGLHDVIVLGSCSCRRGRGGRPGRVAAEARGRTPRIPGCSFPAWAACWTCWTASCSPRRCSTTTCGSS